MTRAVLCVMLAGGLAACSRPKVPDVPTTAVVKAPAPVFATLNGEPLGPDDIAALLPESASQSSAVAVRGAVELAADLRRAQRALGWTSCTPVADDLERHRTASVARLGGEAAWRQRLSTEGRTEAGWRAAACLELMLDRLAGPAPEMPAAELTKRLTHKVGRFDVGRRVQLREMATSGGDPSVLTEARRRLQAGADFADVARQLSATPEGPDGIERGWTRLSELPAPLAAAVSELQAGQLSPLVTTDHGVHLLRVVAWGEPPTPELDAAERTLAAKRLWQREQTLVRRRQMWRQLRAAQPLQWTGAWAPPPLPIEPPTPVAVPAEAEPEEDDE